MADEKAFVADMQKTLQQQYQQYRNRDVPICSLAVHVETEDDCQIESSMGSLVRNQHFSQRTLVVNMLVGDLQKGDITAAGSAGTIRIPLDYNMQAISHILSLEIQNVYDHAEQEFLDRKDKERLEKKSFEPQIYPEKDVIKPEITPFKIADISIKDCKSLLNECTALWNTFGDNIQGNAAMHYKGVRCYDFHDNGSVEKADYHHTTLTLTAALTDETGKIVSTEKIILSEYPADLPEKSSVLEEETAMYVLLQRLADAPAATAGFFPVLFSNQAAAIALRASRVDDATAVCKHLTVKEDATHFTAKTTASQKETALVQQLKQMLKNQHKDYGYWVKSARFSENDGIVPQELYRIYADERANELVRGTVAITPNAHLLAQVSACGDLPDCAVFVNEQSQVFPIVCCAPAVLCDRLYFQDIPQHSTIPLLTPVQQDKTYSDQSFSTLASQVAQDEIRLFFEDTNLLEAPKPYDVEYLFTDAVTCSIQSSLGSSLMVEEHPVRTVGTRLLVGDDQLNNENLYAFPTDNSVDLPLDNDYANTLKAVHRATDDAYRRALLDYDWKIRCLDKTSVRGNPREPDRSAAKRRSFFYEDVPEELNVSDLQRIANDLSGLFSAYKQELPHSGVNVQVFQSMVYFISAQGIQSAQPYELICIQWFAETVTDEGDTLKDSAYYLCRKKDEIPDLNDRIISMAENLIAIKHAPKATEHYLGPVLVSKEAAAALVAYSLLESNPSLITAHEPADHSGYEKNYWEQMKNKPVVSSVLSVTADYEAERFGNTPLLGYYKVDAECVPVSQSTDLIHHGNLVEMLTSRSPSKIGRFSNGHRRLALLNEKLVPTIGAGILEVSSRNTMDESALIKDLLKQARAAGHKYAYQISKFVSRYNEAGQKELFPLYVYRIKTSNGEKTPVRIRCGETFTADILNLVTATSTGKIVFNRMSDVQNASFGDKRNLLNGIPVSLVIPEHFIFKNMRIVP